MSLKTKMYQLNKELLIIILQSYPCRVKLVMSRLLFIIYYSLSSIRFKNDAIVLHQHRLGDISVSLSVQTTDALSRDKCITLTSSSFTVLKN